MLRQMLRRFHMVYERERMIGKETFTFHKKIVGQNAYVDPDVERRCCISLVCVCCCALTSNKAIGQDGHQAFYIHVYGVSCVG